MFNWGLIRKTIHEGAILWLSCALGLFAFAWFRVWVVGKIDSQRFKQIIELLPKEWERFSAVEFDWLISYIGRTSLTLEEPMVILLITLWAVVRGSDVVSGELNRGTMEMVLAQPVSRPQVYWTQALITWLGLAFLCLLLWVGMAIAVETTVIKETSYPEIRIPFTYQKLPIPWGETETQLVPMRDVIQSSKFLPGVINLFFLGGFLCSLNTLISSLDRYRWRTLGIGIAMYFVAAMLKIAAMATPTLLFLKWFTFFTLLEPQLHIKSIEENAAAAWNWGLYRSTGEWNNLGPLGCNLALLALSIICLVIGSRWFQRRDLPAPL